MAEFIYNPVHYGQTVAFNTTNDYSKQKEKNMKNRKPRMPQVRLPKNVMETLEAYDSSSYEKLNKDARNKIKDLLEPYGFKVISSNEGFFSLSDEEGDAYTSPFFIEPNVISFTFEGAEYKSCWIVKYDGPGFFALDPDGCNDLCAIRNVFNTINHYYERNSLNQLALIPMIDDILKQYGYIRNDPDEKEFINGTCILIYRRPYIDMTEIGESICVGLSEDRHRPTIHYSFSIY